MDESDSADSPLEAAAGAADPRAVDAFKRLSNEIRLAILLALWEADEPFKPENALPFSELYDRVDVDDSGNFTYHLDKLTDLFVQEREDGYTLTMRAEKIVHAMLAGTLTEPEPFEDEPIDAECARCGASMVIDYRDGRLIERCTNCEGRWENPETPSGTLRYVYRPPVGLANRTPQEFHRHGNTRDRYQFMLMLEGVCPDCSGPVTTEIRVCTNHDVRNGTVCEECGSLWEMRLHYVCEVCKYDMKTAPFAHIHTDLRVKSFYHDHGLDPDELYDSSAIAEIRDTIAEKTVVSEDPIEIMIAISIDGDRLEMTLDEKGDVIDVTEPSS